MTNTTSWEKVWRSLEEDYFSKLPNEEQSSEKILSDNIGNEEIYLINMLANAWQRYGVDKALTDWLLDLSLIHI